MDMARGISMMGRCVSGAGERMARYRRGALFGCLLALGLLGGQARAAAPGPSGTAAPAAAPTTATDAEVRSHFAKGEAHLDKQEYREALEEFRKVLALQKVRG